MNIYLTFFAIRNNKQHLNIANGFSFGRRKNKDDIDLYLQQGCNSSIVANSIKNYQSVEKIFCSLCYTSHLDSIAPLLDDRWVLGGPLVSGLRDFSKKTGCTIYQGSFESYLGRSKLSNTFNVYFKDFVKAVNIPYVFYNCSIGTGCYWGKCNFCDYHNYGNQKNYSQKITLRPDIGRIIEQLHPMEGCKTVKIHLGIPATPPKILVEILDSKRDSGVILILFLRADKTILKTLSERSGLNVCNSILFSIGCESLSQTALNILNKGTTVENTIEIVRLILERGGDIGLGIMDHYVFTNRQIAAEYLDSLEKLKEIVKEYKTGRVVFTNNGVTLWPNLKVIEEYTDSYISEERGGRHHYIANIPKNSETFYWNKEIALALHDSGIPHQGAPFLSLTQKM